jgi:uncharacterized lipoprotein
MTDVARLAVLLGVGALAACSGKTELVCGREARYREAVSLPTLRIPDDLSVPDESDSLRIPGPVAAAPAATAGEEAEPVCLEESPAFSGAPQP